MHQYLHCKLLEESNFPGYFVIAHFIPSRQSIMIDYIQLEVSQLIDKE